jgi:hypothetical protein
MARLVDSITAVNWVMPSSRAVGQPVQQRLVILVVDFGQVAQLSRGQPPVRVQEPAVDSLNAALLDGCRERSLVPGFDRPDRQLGRRCQAGGLTLAGHGRLP